MEKLPQLELFLFPWELDSMSDYSTTNPSGTTIGKVWRRNVNFTCVAGWRAPDRDNPNWVVCMYTEHPDPRLVRIVTFTVVMKSGPEPRVYRAPDWSYFAGWERALANARQALV